MSKTRCFVACNLISLAAGTPYAYSAYAPQLLSKCNLDVSVNSTFSLALGIGMTLMGLPVGLIIDNLGPNFSIMLGSGLTFLAYLVLFLCYSHAYSSVALISAALVCVGTGAISSFFACVKVCTANFPEKKGTATAFPVSFFALASLLYSGIAATWFHDNVGGFFVFLMLFCSVAIFLGGYSVFIDDDQETRSIASSVGFVQKHLRGSLSFFNGPRIHHAHEIDDEPEPTPFWETHLGTTLKNPKFLFLYVILGTMTGMGQMYIYSVGFIVTTLVRHTPEGHDAAAVQSLQVSIISVMSFLGRLCSGPLSDVLISFNLQRTWLLVLAIGCYLAANHLTATNNSVAGISTASLLFGAGYGTVFGTFPSIIADTFGTHGFSTVWGLIMTGGMPAVKIFSAIFGNTLEANGGVECMKGVDCYSTAFITNQNVIGALGLLVLFTIYSMRRV